MLISAIQCQKEHGMSTKKCTCGHEFCGWYEKVIQAVDAKDVQEGAKSWWEYLEKNPVAIDWVSANTF